MGVEVDQPQAVTCAGVDQPGERCDGWCRCGLRGGGVEGSVQRDVCAGAGGADGVQAQSPDERSDGSTGEQRHDCGEL
jgi:hypothetical protein